MNTVISRAEAQSQGLRVYFTGIPCKRGHLATRHVSNGNCRECRLERDNTPEGLETGRRIARESHRRAWSDPQRREIMRGWARDSQRRKLNVTPTRVEPATCECCGRLPGKYAMNLDHDHATNQFRGWLCGRCNRAIGLLGDTYESVLRAAVYLKRARQ